MSVWVSWYCLQSKFVFFSGVNVAVAEFGDARDDSSWQCWLELTTNLREVSKCPEKVTTNRAFSLLKVLSHLRIN